MDANLAPGFYREDRGEAGVFFVDESRAVWLVFTGDDAELPIRLDDEQAVGIEPFPEIRPDLAAKYRRMVEERTRSPGVRGPRWSERETRHVSVARDG